MPRTDDMRFPEDSHQEASGGRWSKTVHMLGDEQDECELSPLLFRQHLKESISFLPHEQVSQSLGKKTNEAGRCVLSSQEALYATAWSSTSYFRRSLPFAAMKEPVSAVYPTAGAKWLAASPLRSRARRATERRQQAPPWLWQEASFPSPIAASRVVKDATRGNKVAEEEEEE